MTIWNIIHDLESNFSPIFGTLSFIMTIIRKLKEVLFYRHVLKIDSIAKTVGMYI